VRRPILLLARVIGSAVLAASAGALLGAEEPARAVLPEGPISSQETGRIIVSYEGDVSATEEYGIREAKDSFDASVEGRFDDGGERPTELLDVGAKGVGLREAIVELEHVPVVRYAEPEVIAEPDSHEGAEVPPAVNDPFFPKQWALNNHGDFCDCPFRGTPDADMDVDEAWAIQVAALGGEGASDEPSPPPAANDLVARGAGVAVGVSDNGVWVNHPDLKNRLWTNDDEVPDNGVDDDSNGYVDDYHGYNFVRHEGSDNALYEGNPDSDFHGTHVAGIVAAEADNAQGVAGVAPEARVAVLRAYYSTFYGAEAIRYAADNGIRIVNNSWGGSSDVNSNSQVLAEAVSYAERRGVLIVASAGNESLDSDVTPGTFARLPNTNVMIVAATNNDDLLEDFSNRGANNVDLAAPGRGIYSTFTEPQLYVSLGGTSMAAPNAAGVAALVYAREVAAERSPTPATVRRHLMDTGDPLESLSGTTVSGKRVNAARAVSLELGPALPPSEDAIEPAIFRLRPVAGSVTRDRSPTIRARVRDNAVELDKTDIRLFLDGAPKTFSYDWRTDWLSHTTSRLSYGRHRVRVVAEDGVGNRAVRTWSFELIRRR
jgi:subtilisin family serine protease